MGIVDTSNGSTRALKQKVEYILLMIHDTILISHTAFSLPNGVFQSAVFGTGAARIAGIFDLMLCGSAYIVVQYSSRNNQYIFNANISS